MEVTAITKVETNAQRVKMMCPISREECYMFLTWENEDREPFCVFAVHNEEIRNTDCLVMMAFKAIVEKNSVKGGDTDAK